MKSLSYILRGIVLIGGSCCTAFAQSGNGRGDVDLILNDLTKKYYQDKRYDRVEGDPFLLGEWSTGTLELKNGTRYQAMRMKFDIVQQELIVLNGQNTEMIAPAERIRSFELVNENERWMFRSGYPAIEKQTTNSFYRVLIGDTLSLLKFQEKAIVQGNDFDKKKTFILYEDYYIHYNKKLWAIRKKGSLVDVLRAKSKEMESYISENKLKPKDEGDLKKVVRYMNSLVPH